MMFHTMFHIVFHVILKLFKAFHALQGSTDTPLEDLLGAACTTLGL